MVDFFSVESSDDEDLLSIGKDLFSKQPCTDGGPKIPVKKSIPMELEDIPDSEEEEKIQLPIVKVKPFQWKPIKRSQSYVETCTKKVKIPSLNDLPHYNARHFESQKIMKEIHQHHEQEREEAQKQLQEMQELKDKVLRCVNPDAPKQYKDKLLEQFRLGTQELRYYLVRDCKSVPIATVNHAYSVPDINEIKKQTLALDPAERVERLILLSCDVSIRSQPLSRRQWITRHLQHAYQTIESKKWLQLVHTLLPTWQLKYLFYTVSRLPVAEYQEQNCVKMLKDKQYKDLLYYIMIFPQVSMALLDRIRNSKNPDHDPDHAMLKSFTISRKQVLTMEATESYI